MLGRALCLNADGQPHKVYPVEEAIWDLIIGRAAMLEGTGKFAHSQKMEIEIPSVVQLVRYVKQPKGSAPRSIPLTPRNVCARDRFKCAYQIEGLCEGKATTIDHVIPKAQGGKNSWENVVAACRRCNHKKGNRTPAEMDWTVFGKEWTPKTKQWRPIGPVARVLIHAHDNRWDAYFEHARGRANGFQEQQGQKRHKHV